ncbi:YciI family protein [Terrimonas sp. NA20]|uniref:YciI family protein n=1 Tax=Terrimonas ginsenosidimutans TaxID=2908004 RepID=A0ABS9KY22_9BACT|nr:YciI family protein [Terrimonas ginsenosidimutans]MCG2617279.1 YciI family protein [Terrimonas ginsenosidimutans]
MRKFFLFLLSITTLFACNSTTENAPVATGSPKYDLNADTSVYSGEMKRYWLVLLKSGNNRSQDSASAAKIQSAHMANINRLAKEGKLIMAGPIGAEADLRGIFIMDAKDSTEIEALVNTDTAVITGRLKMEYYPWWSEKGKFIFK